LDYATFEKVASLLQSFKPALNMAKLNGKKAFLALPSLWNQVYDANSSYFQRG